MAWVFSVLWVLLWIVIWILIVAAGIVLLFLLFLAAPISYSVNAEIGDNTTAKVRCGYMFRFVTLTYEYRDKTGSTVIRIAGIKLGAGKKGQISTGRPAPEELPAAETAPQEARIKKNEGSQEKSKGGMLNSLKSVLTYPQIKTIIKMTLDALKKMFKVILPRHLDISGEVGFADPSSTGFFIGAYEALVGILSLRQKIRLTGIFETDKTTVRLNISAKGSLSVARLLIPLLKVIFKEPMWSFIKDIWRKGDSDE